MLNCSYLGSKKSSSQLKFAVGKLQSFRRCLINACMQHFLNIIKKINNRFHSALRLVLPRVHTVHSMYIHDSRSPNNSNIRVWYPYIRVIRYNSQEHRSVARNHDITFCMIANVCQVVCRILTAMWIKEIDI